MNPEQKRKAGKTPVNIQPPNKKRNNEPNFGFRTAADYIKDAQRKRDGQTSGNVTIKPATNKPATVKPSTNITTQPKTINPFNTKPIKPTTTATVTVSKPSAPNTTISISQTSTVHTTPHTITLSPSSFAEMTAPTFTVDDLLPRVDVTANSVTLSGITKREPKTTTDQPSTSKQPKESIKSKNKRLKNEGRIRISLHGTEVYTKPEILCILRTLRARNYSFIGENLVQAEVLTGTYTHASQISQAIQNKDQVDEEVGSLIDQSTQANGKMIDDATYAQTISEWQPLRDIPQLIENKDIIPSDIKPADIIFNPRAFINYTKYAIPEDVAVILAMGPKFAVPVYNSDDDFENLKGTAFTLNEIYGHPDGKAEVRTNIEKYIHEYRHNQKAYRTENKDYFDNAIRTTKRFIKQHPDIIAAQSDKARATILLDKEVYTNKVENLLRDRNTYQPLSTSSTRSYMIMNENLLKRMVEHKMATQNEISAAIANENQPANLYGLIKNHKEDAPMRPIVNTRNSMGFLLATKATEILTTARDKGLRYNVLNSRMACERIRQTKILPDEKLYSLDIVSMFTNITVDRAITSVLKRQKQLNINSEQAQIIVDIIKFVCIKSTEIRFNDRIYKQIKGLRMGSSLSPILADFVVEDMLDTAFLTIERPKLLMKYVDDILCVLEVSEAERILHALNNCDPHIKFEMETEKDDKINYLDVTIYRDECELKTMWYQKHISSGLFLNYHTNHPRTTIRNTAVQYVVTMVMNTHPDNFSDIIKIAMERLNRNSYPTTIAKQIIEEAKMKIAQKQLSTPDGAMQDDISYTRSIEYIPKLTGKIQKEIIDSHKKQGEERNIQIPAVPMYTMNKLIYNHHKNSNSKFNMEEYETESEAPIDLTQPSTSHQNT